MRTSAIIVAGGTGVRMGTDRPKQFLKLLGRPLLRWSAEAFETATEIDRTIVAIDPARRDEAREALRGLNKVELASSGATRIASTRAGLAALSAAPPDAVVIHDAARPGFRASDVGALLAGLASFDAVAPFLPAADALKRRDGAGVLADLDREGVVRVQTPQAVRFKPYVKAMDAVRDDDAFDDDLAIARAAGLSAGLIAGAHRLMKATYPEDLAMLEVLLGAGAPAVGAGFDAHRFGPGDHVTLCGVRIAHDAGLIGHSDADAGWHALTDAILGALGLGDIGDHFPPSDPQWRGAASEIFLARAVELAHAQGARLAHVDVTLICERPKIKPHREAMRERTAAVLGLPIARVSIKATTTEGMGFTGREEGLAAQAAATLILSR
jgi:2-C-methyl-D-erythritol 4-phosphate cytidylyltransferase/2-C-methyl-D-erythritol 2,4-cyclodiphosphate synthase